MTEAEKIQAKDRIFDAAVALFARKGYAAVGVREIAREADVNISMISYYYSGKLGILKAVIEQFYVEYLEVLESAIIPDLPIDKQTRKLIRSIVYFMKSRRDLCKVGITEIPYDEPEIARFKSARVVFIKNLIFNRFFRDSGLIIEDKVTISILSPALISVIYSNFLLGDIIKNVLDIEFDEAYYERYANTISTFIMGGIMSVVREEGGEEIEGGGSIPKGNDL